MTTEYINQYKKYYAYLGMLYITIMLVSAILTSKLIVIGSHTTLAGALVVPIIFSISDIIAELYEYKSAKQIIFFAFICQLIFTIFTYFLSHLSSPSFWHGQSDYDFVLGPLFRISIGSFSAYLLSSIINIYILSKWKVLWHGKFFLVRSIGSSTVGELFFTILAVLLLKYGSVPWKLLFDIMMMSYIIKVIGSFICAIFANLVVIYIKKLNRIAEVKAENPSVQSPFNLKIVK